MKKLIYFSLIFGAIIAMGGCTIDDSNDIEIIKPGDTTLIGKASIRQGQLIR